MYVRLAAAWADPTGAVHGAGEFVDVDVVTLAELEEQGVVENAGEEEQPEYIGPGEVEKDAEPGYIGPGEADEDADDAAEEE